MEKEKELQESSEEKLSIGNVNKHHKINTM